MTVDRAEMNRKLYAALKPGGSLVIAMTPGSEPASSETAVTISAPHSTIVIRLRDAWLSRFKNDKAVSVMIVAGTLRVPLALAARHEDGLALLVGEPIECSLDCEIGAPLSPSGARVCKHVGPPFFARRLLRVRPGPPLDCVTRLHHGGD